MRIVHVQNNIIHLRDMMKRSLQQDSYLEKTKVGRKSKRDKLKAKFDNKNKRKKFDDHDWDDRD